MAPRRGPVVGGLGRAPLTDKYRNITNQRTVQGVLRSGGPLTGSASGVRSISSVDAFNALGQFFIGEALAVPVAAGVAKIIGRVLPRAARVAGAGVRPMTTAERSAAVTRAGRTGVGKIGPSIRPKAWYENHPAIELYDITDFGPGDSSYAQVYERAADILKSRGKVSPDKLVPISGPLVNTRYRGFKETINLRDAYENPWTGEKSDAAFDMITGAMKKTLDWAATRRPLRKTASVKRRTRQ